MQAEDVENKPVKRKGGENKCLLGIKKAGGG